MTCIDTETKRERRRRRLEAWLARQRLRALRADARDLVLRERAQRRELSLPVTEARGAGQRRPAKAGPGSLPPGPFLPPGTPRPDKAARTIAALRARIARLEAQIAGRPGSGQRARPQQRTTGRKPPRQPRS